MYAIVKDGGHQYKCEVGRKMYLELRDVEDGAKIELTDVLLLVKGEEGKEETIIGQPTVEGAKVVCEVMTKRKGPKVVIRWFRRRKNSRSCFNTVGRIDNNHTGYTSHKSYIFAALVARAVFTDGNTRVSCTYFNIEVRVTY